jgi:hypothetical protein
MNEPKEKLMIIKDKKQKRKLDKVPDRDKNGEPIYKIADIKTEPKRKEDASKPK